MANKKLITTLACAFIISLGTFECLAADLGGTCILPLKSIQKSELRSITYDGNSNIISRAKLANPSLSCTSGSLKVKNSILDFHQGKLIPKNVVALDKTDVYQRGQRYGLSKDSHLEISTMGYIKKASNIEKTTLQRGKIKLTLKGPTNFNKKGEILNSEIFSIIPPKPNYLGSKVNWATGNSIYFKSNGDFYVEGSPDLLSGIWTLSAQEGNLKISIKHNEKGLYKSYYVSGSVELFGESLMPVTSGEAISEDFFPALEGPVEIKFKFSQKVEIATEEGTSVTYIDKFYPAEILLDSEEKFEAIFPNQKAMSFEKASAFQAAFENIILFFKFLISIILTAIFSMVAIALALHILRWFFSTKKIDRRYKKQGYAAPFFRALGITIIGLITVVITSVFLETLILSSLNISWPMVYINYAFF